LSPETGGDCRFVRNKSNWEVGRSRRIDFFARVDKIIDERSRLRRWLTPQRRTADPSACGPRDDSSGSRRRPQVRASPRFAEQPLTSSGWRMPAGCRRYKTGSSPRASPRLIGCMPANFDFVTREKRILLVAFSRSRRISILPRASNQLRFTASVKSTEKSAAGQFPRIPLLGSHPGLRDITEDYFRVARDPTRIGRKCHRSLQLP
jgi:hypothetical protein